MDGMDGMDGVDLRVLEDSANLVNAALPFDDEDKSDLATAHFLAVPRLSVPRPRSPPAAASSRCKPQSSQCEQHHPLVVSPVYSPSPPSTYTPLRAYDACKMSSMALRRLAFHRQVCFNCFNCLSICPACCAPIRAHWASCPPLKNLSQLVGYCNHNPQKMTQPDRSQLNQDPLLTMVPFL
jgi:hypothetical protein